MLLFSFLHLFPIHILLQQHRGIWTSHLETKGDFHQSNPVLTAVGRVHKTEQQQRKFQVLKQLGRIPPCFPYNNRDLGLQNNPPNHMWKMSLGRADFSFLQLLWFSLCYFCSSTTLSGHHMLYRRREQGMMPATECWEETLEGLDEMTSHCFYMCQTKYKIIPSKGRQRILTNCLTSLGCNPWTDIKNFVFKYTVISEPCIGQSPTTITCSTRSLNRYSNDFLYTQTSTNPQPGFGTQTKPSSAAERWHLSSPIPGWLHDHDGFYLIKENLSLLQRVSVSGIPASSQFDPFCRWSCLSSVPPFCGHKLLLLRSCNVDFPFAYFRIHIVLSFSPTVNIRTVAYSHWRQKQNLQDWRMSSERHVAADTAQRSQATWHQGSPVENKLAMGHQRKD